MANTRRKWARRKNKCHGNFGGNWPRVSLEWACPMHWRSRLTAPPSACRSSAVSASTDILKQWCRSRSERHRAPAVQAAQFLQRYGRLFLQICPGSADMLGQCRWLMPTTFDTIAGTKLTHLLEDHAHEY